MGLTIEDHIREKIYIGIMKKENMYVMFEYN